MALLQSPQPPPTELILTTLLNDITTISDNFILVLDDYHVIDSKPVDASTSVDDALTFLLEHLPPQMHLVIATREDPSLPLARYRARGQLTELRAADLRFTPAEAAEFLNRVMGLNLSEEDVAALETRTEGWIAGLQMAAISMQGLPDAASFVRSFTGSHRFVLDYLLEEVLQRQPLKVQTFLLRTSILNRMCGPLCDAILLDPSIPGQETLEVLERSNLFIIPLDNERHWFRYHHLFADLLRHRLQRIVALSTGKDSVDMEELHIRASQWYEDNGLEIEAFQHAAAANDIERAERLMEGKGLPLHLRGATTAMLNWLEALPTSVLNARPSLWLKRASLLLVMGQTSTVEENLRAAEAAFVRAARPGAEPDDKTREFYGRIALARATLAFTQYRAETILVQARRALEFLPPDDLTRRAQATWTMGFAYLLQGNRAASGRTYAEAVALNQAAGDVFTLILATNGLGNVQELENQLYLAAETFRRSLQLAGDPPLPHASGAHLGLARIYYEWNDLEAAEQHGQQGLQLARQYDQVIDRFIVSEVFLARLKLAQGDVDGAASMLSQTEQTARQKNFTLRLPEIAAAQVQVLLKQTNLPAAAELARRFELPLSQARVFTAQGDSSAALAVLEPFRQQMEARGWADERLKAMVLQAVALHRKGEKSSAVQLLGEALALAEPGGFIRLFVDEGEPMRLLILDFRLLIEKQLRGQDHKLLGYVDKLLAAFAPPAAMPQSPQSWGLGEIKNQKSTMVEPLSQRELKILHLIAQGLSNREISERLFLALSTVKGHNRNIFDKLQVQSRTEAVARASELGLL